MTPDRPNTEHQSQVKGPTSLSKRQRQSVNVMQSSGDTVDEVLLSEAKRLKEEVQSLKAFVQLLMPISDLHRALVTFFSMNFDEITGLPGLKAKLHRATHSQTPYSPSHRRASTPRSPLSRRDAKGRKLPRKLQFTTDVSSAKSHDAQPEVLGRRVDLLDKMRRILQRSVKDLEDDLAIEALSGLTNGIDLDCRAWYKSHHAAILHSTQSWCAHADQIATWLAPSKDHNALQPRSSILPSPLDPRTFVGRHSSVADTPNTHIDGSSSKTENDQDTDATSKKSTQILSSEAQPDGAQRSLERELFWVVLATLQKHQPLRDDEKECRMRLDQRGNALLIEWTDAKGHEVFSITPQTRIYFSSNLLWLRQPVDSTNFRFLRVNAHDTKVLESLGEALGDIKTNLVTLED